MSISKGREYASETMELVGDYIGPYTFGGRIYGLPTLRNYAKNGYIASYICGSEMGVDVVKAGTWKIPCLAVQTASAMIKTSQPMFTGIGVPYTAEEPEAAVKFLNLMYTDSKLMNMITWGVEGEDYTVKDGEVVHDKESYFLGADFVMGNSLLLTPLEGNGADFYERVKQVNATSPVSQFMGFAIDTTDLDQYIANITAVTDQYHQDLFSGLYTEEFYAEYMAKLEAADVRGYLNAVQTQLDAWLAANGK